MRRVVAVLVATLALALAAATASADVHGVSQAGCAPDGVPAGATAQPSRDAPGRPDPAIPVSASEEKTESKGGDAPAQGPSC
jgi:hypothetical protein